MNAFDIAFIFFFISILVKVGVDTYEYWYGEDGILAASDNTIKPAVTPKHIPAPMRPSPAAPNFRTAPASYVVRPMPTTTGVKTVPSTARVAKPIKKQPVRVA